MNLSYGWRETHEPFGKEIRKWQLRNPNLTFASIGSTSRPPSGRTTLEVAISRNYCFDRKFQSEARSEESPRLKAEC
jgi:hypothetical protein